MTDNAGALAAAQVKAVRKRPARVIQEPPKLISFVSGNPLFVHRTVIQHLGAASLLGKNFIEGFLTTIPDTPNQRFQE